MSVEHREPVVKEDGKARRLQALEWLAQRSRGILEDPRKARWHQDTRKQLEQIEAEIQRLSGKAVPPGAKH